MAQLLLLTSILLALSGLIKIRSGFKAGIGLPWIAIAELLSAAVVLAVVAVGLATIRAVGWLAPAGVLMVIVSSIAHVLRVSARRRDREARLGARLDAYVRYLSKPERSAGDEP